MAMPSRKNIARIIFFVFIVGFLGAIGWYLYPVIRGASDTENNTEFDNGRDTTLFPFGEGQGNGAGKNGGDTGNNDLSQGGDDQVGIVRQPQMRKISDGPVIGAVFANAQGHGDLKGVASAQNTDKDVENVFRYIELGTGHVYQGTTIGSEITRISNTTIPKINQALFADLDNVVLRYVDSGGRIKTFSAKIVSNFAQSAATEKKLQGVFLPDNLRSMIVSTLDKTLLYLSDIDGETALLQSSLLGEGTKKLFSSPVSQWNLQYTGTTDDQVLLTSTPSYDSFGVSYVLNTKTAANKPYIPARKALGVLPTDDLSRALVAMNISGGTKLFVWVRDTNQYIDIGLSSFVEKCAWAQNRQKFYCAVPAGVVAEAEPDLWYQGVTSYNDEIWEIDAQTGQTRLVVAPISVTQDSLDMIDFAISPDEQFLYFRDKTKRSLWSVQLDYDVLNTEQDNQAEESNPDSQGQEDSVDNFFE